MHNATSILATSAQRAASPSLSRRLVLPALQRMKEGGLALSLPDGIRQFIGSREAAVQAEMTIHRDDFFQKVLRYGDIGFGESYVDGDWDTPSIERVIAWAIVNLENGPGLSGGRTQALALNLLRWGNRVQHLLRPNSKTTAQRNIAEHYDLGNAFYKLWLDPTLTYSSACFTSREQTLEAAQLAKYDALCRKTKLCATDHLLEIGTGWGGLACYAAEHYGCRVTTVTISQQQFDYAQARVAAAGLSDRITVELRDYRDLTGQYDKIISIEMMEALGDQYLSAYCQQLTRLLKPAGLVGVQYITVPDSRHAELRRGVDWIQKHIFPGSLLLSIGRVSHAFSQTGNLFLHDLEDLGLSYARTLREWFQRFNAVLPAVRAQGFDEAFIRKWNYYLQYCEAAFAQRNISVVQAIYTKPNNPLLQS